MKNRNDGDGRDEGFRHLYQKHYWRVVRYLIVSFHLSEEDAQELAQDAFLRFYEAMEEYRGDAEWAFFERIARNLALNRVRSKKTRKRSANVVDLDDPHVPEIAAAEGPDYAERQEEARRLERLHEEIPKLPAGQQECLLLWLQELAYEDIANRLGITVDAVKSRIRDAKRLLRDRMGLEVDALEE